MPNMPSRWPVASMLQFMRCLKIWLKSNRKWWWPSTPVLCWSICPKKITNQVLMWYWWSKIIPKNPTSLIKKMVPMNQTKSWLENWFLIGTFRAWQGFGIFHEQISVFYSLTAWNMSGFHKLNFAVDPYLSLAFDQCLKITQNCSIWIFEFCAFSTNFSHIKNDLSGNNVWPHALGFQKFPKIDNFWPF